MASDQFRDLMCRFPTGVAVVTTMNLDGVPFGMTCSSLSSVCLTPPTLLICLRTTSATCQAVRDRGRFAVNLLKADAAMVAQLFSSASSGRFSRVRWATSPNGMPWLDDDVGACADGRVVAVKEVGDHTVVFGEMMDIRLEDEPPLLYGMRQYFRPGSHALQTQR